jgi:hypothetical protein
MEVLPADLDRVGIAEQSKRALRFNVTARLHRERRLALQDGTLKKLYRTFAVTIAIGLKQLTEIFRQLLVKTLPRDELDLPQFLTGGQVNAIGWEPVFDQPCLHSVPDGVIVEDCYKDCAHAR